MSGETGGLLALDLSTHVGWAYGVDHQPPLHGVWELGQWSLGERMSRFAGGFGDAVALHRPALVILESPLPPAAQTSMATARIQFGLAAVAEMICHEERIKVEEAKADDARQLVLGRMRWPKGQTKLAIIAWCQQQGWRPVGDNDADAMVLWRYRWLLTRTRIMAGAGSVGR